MADVLIDNSELQALRREAGRRDVCWYCGGQLIWGSDFSLSDIEGEGVEGIYTELHCADCGAEITYTFREGDDE